MKKVFCEEPESCIGCKLCVKACSHRAIVMERREKSYILKITEKCEDCGDCIDQCPMKVLVLR